MPSIHVTLRRSSEEIVAQCFTLSRWKVFCCLWKCQWKTFLPQQIASGEQPKHTFTQSKDTTTNWGGCISAHNIHNQVKTWRDWRADVDVSPPIFMNLACTIMTSGGGASKNCCSYSETMQINSSINEGQKTRWSWLVNKTHKDNTQVMIGHRTVTGSPQNSNWVRRMVHGATRA